MIALAVTTAASDERLALPAALVAAESALAVATAREWIDAAGDLICRDVLKRELWRQAYLEEVPGKGGQVLALSRWPIEDDPPPVSTIDGSAMDTSTYSVQGRHRHSLYRRYGWELAGLAEEFGRQVISPTDSKAYSVAYTAGYLMPGQVSTWAAATAYQTEPASISYDDPLTGVPYVRGAWVRSADRRVQLRFECTTAGTTGASEPAAFTASATAAGDTIADGTAVWTARAAFELPAILQKAALKIALWLYRISDEEQDLKIEEMWGQGGKLRVEHFGSVHEIPPSALRQIEGYL